jgi:hypothetical protein
MQKIKSLLLVSFLMVMFAGCSDKVLTLTDHALPEVSNNKSIKIMLFPLKNYTDTPRAGMRASNIVEGVLSAKSYKVIYNTTPTLKKEAAAMAKSNGSDYYMLGAVSEWRYKTGIDGEPAVSFRLALYNTKTDTLVWSGVGSNNDWGNGSIGTTAQSLIEEMLEK